MHTQPYYRSRVFTPTRTQSPLIANTHVIFALLNHVQSAQTFLIPATLHEHLYHELHAFTTQMQVAETPHATIQVAHYILCATLDDVLNHLGWPPGHAWTRYHLLPLFCEDRGRDQYQRFFAILERLLAQPKRHHALLELMYYCLLFGFQGPYRRKTTSKEDIAHLLDRLHTQIRPQEDIQHIRFIPSFAIKNNTEIPQTAKQRVLSGKSALLLTGILLLTLYTGLDYMRRLRENPLRVTVHTLLQQNQI